jgi:hypothetical protein
MLICRERLYQKSSRNPLGLHILAGKLAYPIYGKTERLHGYVLTAKANGIDNIDCSVPLDLKDEVRR